MSESIKLQDKFGKKIPWILGEKVRCPRVKFPVYREGSFSLPSPGRSLILSATYIFLFYLVMGGIYIVIRDPIAMGADSNQKAMWLYPSTHEAFIIESIVAAFLIFTAGAGFFIVYNSTKHAFNYRYAIKLLVFGLFFAALSFGLLQYMMAVKTKTI